MPEQYGNVYSDMCLKLRDGITESKTKIQHTIDSQKAITSLESQISTSTNLINSLTDTQVKLRPFMKEITVFLNDKRKKSRAAINAALRIAGVIVPDSMGSIQLQIEGKEAWLETADGMYVDRCEGGGYKGAASVFLESVMLRSNPMFMQTMILDEPCSRLSADNSVTLSTYLPTICQDMQIILIEQKPEICSTVSDAWRYKFFKNDMEQTIVERVYVNDTTESSSGN